jgi:hypothetical protein
MIKFENNGLQISYQKMYDGGDVLKWNLEIKPFVV